MKTQQKHNPFFILICGPTASHKSSLAYSLATHINGSIINADSQQIYQYLDILTASPTKKEKGSIPHHLYNTILPYAKMSSGQWAQQAKKIIVDTYQKNRVPIVVGGTGLYIEGLIKGIAEIPDIPDMTRQQGFDLFKQLGKEAFYEELLKKDPLVKEKIKPTDKQRMLRAWEVITHTNKSIFQWYKESPGQPFSNNFLPIVCLPERQKLYNGSHERLLKMIQAGALYEVAHLNKCLNENQMNEVKAIGFPDLNAYLNNQISFEKAVENAAQKTRNYAKRQCTWFKNRQPKSKFHETILIDSLNNEEKLHTIKEIKKTIEKIEKNA